MNGYEPDGLKNAADSLAATLKSQRLRSFFLPEQVEVDPDGYHSIRVPPYPISWVFTPLPAAIRDRLDDVLGPENWSEDYTRHGDYTQCVLRVRFVPGPDWVQRHGLASGNDEKAEAVALKEAAKRLGIGRYLESFAVPGTWGDNSEPPALHENALPDAAKRCGREDSERVRGLLGSVVAEMKRINRPITEKEAAQRLAAKWGYAADSEGNVNFSRCQKRHAAEMIQSLADSLAQLAKTVPPSGENNSKKDAPAQTTTQPQETKRQPGPTAGKK